MTEGKGMGSKHVGTRKYILTLDLETLQAVVTSLEGREDGRKAIRKRSKRRRLTNE